MASPNKLDKKLRASQEQVQQLIRTVDTLRSEVELLEAEVARWQRKARKHKSRAAKLRAAAESAIAEATTVARKRASARALTRSQQIADHPRAEPLALRDAPGLPEPTWTVTRLREAARDQGVAGYARMRKDELLAALI